ncbi:MAG: CTP synthase [Clostridiales bacterium]|nr:CTP synthase [Clostridiales bacterium]
MNTKYIFVTGGVVSGLGKGITAAALGRLLKNRGYKVVIQKFDQYINIDPGKMNPIEHGEVFVTDDGTETDLDLGHYERFIDENLTCKSSLTTGKIYSSVINKERSGEYGGKTVQVIPHITNEVKENIYSFKNTDVDIVIVEIGGTVGDIEGLYLIEAIRQIGTENLKEDVAYVHVTLLPYISGSNELKSKPTQHSVKELQSFGIKPDILVCRSDVPIPHELKEKISLFCNVTPDNVIENKTVNCLYEVPLMLEKEGLGNQICKHLQIENKVDNKKWEEIVNKYIYAEKEINIAIVGKYTQLEDSYLSVIESITHAGINNDVKVNIEIINSNELLEENVKEKLSKFSGIIVPGGFGKEGTEGKIIAIKYARENNIPFLGIGLGMQLSVIEFARNVLNIKDATTEEFDKTAENKIIHIISDNSNTMRLGSYPCLLKDNSLAHNIYNEKTINERHRNKYEFNNSYLEILENNGMIVSGKSVDGRFVEIVEIQNNKFFIGTQFHPEFKSRPNRPAPLFDSLIKACIIK